MVSKHWKSFSFTDCSLQSRLVLTSSNFEPENAAFPTNKPTLSLHFSRHLSRFSIRQSQLARLLRSFGAGICNDMFAAASLNWRTAFSDSLSRLYLELLVVRGRETETQENSGPHAHTPEKVEWETTDNRSRR